MFKIILIAMMTCSLSFAAAVGVNKLSSKKLEKDFKAHGLDSIVKTFYKTSLDLEKKFSKKKPNSKGLRVVSKKDKKDLVRLVLAAEEITDKYDKSNLHYYGFSKLYKSIPLDLSLAIERSGLTAQEKQDMRTTLKNNLK